MKIQRSHLWMLVAALVVGVLVLLMLRPDPVSVETGVVDRGLVRVTVDEDGETRVRERYVISAPVTGRMVRVLCEVGDSVAAGEVLARVYPLPLDTRAGTEAARRLEAAEAAWRASRARVAQAETLWGEARRGLERLKGVAAEVPGAISPQRIDEAETAERSAAFALEQARSAAESAGHEVESARTALLGAEGGPEPEPTLVRAPEAGRVLRLYEECERVITAGSPILEVGDPADLEVVVDVLTEDAARLEEGAAARVTAGPAADTLVGHIERIEPSAFTKVSPLGVEEQRVNVIVTFEGEPVLPGDRYRVEVSLVEWQADDVLRVPVSALFRTEDGGWGVFVARDGQAELRRVELGHRARRMAEVRAGLSEGETVVLYPSEDVEDGVRVATRHD